MSKCFEDIAVGDTWEFGPDTVTRAEIIEFAESWDPQYFHLDADRAADSMFGGLVASGLHVLAVTFRMIVEDVFSEIEVMGGRGFDTLRMHQPVRPGDTLSGTTQVCDKRVSDSHADRGYVDWEIRVADQDGEPVLTFTDLSMVRRRAGETDVDGPSP